MRLGFLADIHEEVDRLDACVAALRERGVDRFVVLGDVFERGPRLAETVHRLSGLGAVPHQRGFIGHLHRWLARTATRQLEWAGEVPITLPAEQTLVVAHAVQQGWCGLYDTDTGVLEPIRAGSP